MTGKEELDTTKEPTPVSAAAASESLSRARSKEGRVPPPPPPGELGTDAGMGTGTGTARKRDRDSQFGPTTPGGEETGSRTLAEGVDTASTGSAAHAAKKNRIISRDNSLADMSGAKAAQAEPFRSEDEDLETTPPGTPVLPSAGRKSSIPASPAVKGGKLPFARDTPPGTPPQNSRSLPGGPETNRVKEMRERVQEMTTDEAERLNSGNTSGNISSAASTSAPSPPTEDVQAEIADLPESAAAAEADPEFKGHLDGDVIIQEPEPVSTSSGSASSKAPVPQLSTSSSFPLTAPAVAALSRASSSLIPPPSPASSVRAETGSNAGDSDYLMNDFPASMRPGPSRMSSVSSMRSVVNTGGFLHSALPPRTGSGVDSFSDALSDVSTDVIPPETPRPAIPDQDDATASAPPTPLAAAGSAAAQASNGSTSPTASSGPAASLGQTEARQPSSTQTAGVAHAAGGVQANFGRSTPAFSAISSSAAPAKPFVNPFSSFGSAASSPFASSSKPAATGSAASSSAGAVSGSSTGSAKPFGTSSFGAFGSSSASLFASQAGKKSALGKSELGSTAADKDDEEEDEDKDTVEQDGSLEAEKESGKVFSTTSEVAMVTGEEDESTQYQSARAKLFVMDGSEWKERGVGTLRLNTKTDAADERLSVRMVMRSDAVHRLILNVSLFPDMSVTLAQDKFIRFSAFEDGKPRHYTVRTGNPTQGRELHQQIVDAISMLPKARQSASPAPRANAEV